jgi:hypothetical protein
MLDLTVRSARPSGLVDWIEMEYVTISHGSAIAATRKPTTTPLTGNTYTEGLLSRL